MEMHWKSLNSDSKKQLLNKILFTNSIDILILSNEWNHINIDLFINSATYDDAIQLSNLIKAMVGRSPNKNLDDVIRRNKSGKVIFWSETFKRCQDLIALLGALHSSAINDPQIFDTIPDRPQYSHLIETLKKI